MLNILPKIIAPLAILAFGMVAGIGVQQKVFSSPPEQVVDMKCPDCICPQSAVSVQPFEVEKIKNLKAFTYSPEFTGSISVAGVDSIAIKRYIDHAVMRAFEKHVKSVAAEPSTKRKRK
ncbi:MAG TPA: hypothetical protein VK589_30075 [Chryseolinea sp.]|nr:hypothetical protein [Chryseolinea sp.]